MTRFLTPLLSILVASASLCACVEALDETALEAGQAAQTADRFPVAITLGGLMPEGPESYSGGGVDYTIELDGVYLVAGNTTVLAKGDPVPAYNPSSLFAPLSPGKRADEGYLAVDLTADAAITVGEVEVPAGWAGPAYLSLTNADRSARPENLDEVPEVNDHMLLVDATLRREPDFERRVVALVPGEELLVLGAPGFRVDGSRRLHIEIDLRGWFEGVDPTLLVVMTNTIFLTETENTVAWEKVSQAALAALADATVTLE